MQRFDPSIGNLTPRSEPSEPDVRPLPALHEAASILAEQAALVLVAVLVAALTACIALLALDARQGAGAVLNRMIGATKIVVFLDSRTSRKDAETIGARLAAEPGIRAARFRSREEAFSEIAATHKDSLSVEIPLPASWVFSLQATASNPESPSLISATDLFHSKAAALTGVDSVSFDRQWIAQLDRWGQWRRDLSTGILVMVVGALLVVLFGIFFLASRALPESKMIDRAQASGLTSGVFTCIGLAFASLTGIATFILHGCAAFAWGQMMPLPSGGLLEPWLTAVSRSQTGDTLTVAAAILVASLSAAWLAPQRR